jgi:hypothetical protein
MWLVVGFGDEGMWMMLLHGWRLNSSRSSRDTGTTSSSSGE